jgi:hypothetical protein
MNGCPKPRDTDPVSDTVDRLNGLADAVWRDWPRTVFLDALSSPDPEALRAAVEKMDVKRRAV